MLWSVAGIASAMLVIVAGGYLFAPVALARAYSAVFSDGGAAVSRDISYGAHERQRLDLYRPSTEAAEGPVVVFIYGGGWRDGHREAYGFVGAALAARGLTVVLPDYRLFPQVRFPAFVDDIASVVHWARENVSAGDGAARPLILMGHSAGAHIAALLASDPSYFGEAGEGEVSVAGLIGLAGPYTFDPTEFDSTREIFAGVADADRTRPTALVTADNPPALLMHGLGDETVKIWNTREFAKALIRAGVDVSKIEYPSIGHAGLILSLSWPFRWRNDALDRIMHFVGRIADGK